MTTVRLIPIVLVAVSAAAQSTPQQSVVSGIVLDPSGAMVPGAVVEMQRPAGKTVESAVADDSGRFRFTVPANGNCAVRITRSGFKEATTKIRLSGRPVELTVRLELAEIFSEVSAEMEPVAVVAEVASNRDAVSLDANLLDKIPVFDQDYLARMSIFLDPGAIGTRGASLVVDGVEANNIGVSASAIREIRINQNPYSAEFYRPGRGRIEVITKDAGSAFHGTFNFTFRDSEINARDPFALVRAPEQRRILEGSLLGPLGRSKKNSFLLSASRQDDDLQAVIYARDLTGPIQSTTPSPRGLTQVAVRIGRQFSANHAAFLQYNDREYPGHNLGVGGLVLAEAGTDPDHWEREVVFNDRLTLSTHWINQFQILIGREHEGMHSITHAPGIVVQGAFTGGGAQVDILRTENHFQASDVTTYSSGRHTLKAGINVPDWSRRGVNDYSNFGGTFYFSSLADYAARRPYAYQVQQGPGHVVYVQKELGGFVQDDIKLRPNFSLALGMRYDWQNFLGDNNNFAPRVAFAWAPLGSKTTVVRGGAGVFFDRTGYVPLADLELYNGQILRSYLIAQPAFPNPFVGGGLPASRVVRLDPAVREPYSLQYSISAERQLAKRTTLAATWRGNRGVKLFRSRDANAPLPPDYSARPDSGIGTLRQIESSGRQEGSAVDVTLQGDVTRRFTGIAQYTWNRTNNNTGGIAWFPADQYDPRGEWSRADFDQRHRFSLLGTFNLGKRMGLGTALTFNTGAPYTVTTGADPFRTGMANARPPGVPRNSLEGPGYAEVDLRWSRDFLLSPKKRDKGPTTTIAFDAFNTINHVNYASYVGNSSSPFFGKAVSALPARRLQVTVRFKF